MKAVRPIIASNGVPYLQMRSEAWYTTSGREKEGNKERTGHGTPLDSVDCGMLFEEWNILSLGMSGSK